MSEESYSIVKSYCDAKICRERSRFQPRMESRHHTNLEIQWREEHAPYIGFFDDGSCFRFAYPMRHIPDRCGSKVVWCYPQEQRYRGKLCENIGHDHLLLHDLFVWGQKS